MIAIMQLPDRFSDIEPLTRALQTFAAGRVNLKKDNTGKKIKRQYRRGGKSRPGGQEPFALAPSRRLCGDQNHDQVRRAA
jgi:hypothetical protein